MSHLPFEIAIRLVVVVSVCFSSFSPLLAQAAPNRRSAGYLGEVQAAAPVAAFSADPLSGNAPLDVAFSNNSTAATLYEWDFGDGTGSTEASPNHTYSQSGVYSISLQAGDGVVTDTLTLTGYITVSAPAAPVAAFNAAPVAGDAPLTVAFSNISTAATLYEWDFGDGTTSSEADPTHIYLTPGAYTVTLQAGDTLSGTGGAVTDTLTLTDYITVNEPVASLPQAEFAASPLSGTAPLTVTFTNSSTNASVYEWDFGDGVSSFILPPSFLTTTHVYTAGGVYTISLRAGNGVVTDTLTRTAYLTVTDVVTPVAAFSADPLSGTAPLTVTFSNNSANAGQYLWDFGDGATSTEANPGHTYSQSGLYTVTLQAGATLSGTGGIVTDTLRQAGYIEVVAPDTPHPDFSASPVSGTIPLTVTFTNNSTNADRYVWDFGDGTSTFSLQPSTLTETHSYTQAGVYTVSLQAGDTFSGTGGVITRTLSRANYITVTAPVTTEFSAFPQQGTLPLLVQFLNTSGGANSYVWDFGDGTGSTETSPSHIYSQSGVYTVSLQAGSTLVTGTLTRTGYITVTDSSRPALAIGVTAPATVTVGELITYTLTVTNSGNITASNVVITNALPANATYISGGSLAGRVVSWPAGSLAPGTSVSVDLGVTASTTITNSDYGATAAGGVVVAGVEPVVTLVTAPLVVDFSAFPHQAAAPTLVQFLDNSSGPITAYAWDFGDGLTSTLASPTHTYSTTGVYSVSLTISSPTDSATLTRPNYISVTQPVTAALPTTPLTVDFNAFPQRGTLPLLVQFLNNSSGATGYAWDFGDGLTSTLASPTHTYVTAGTYTVTLMALDAGGRTPVSRSRAITVRPAVMPLIGQPARVQIAVKRSASPGNPIKPGGPQSETDYWLAVTVLDAGGQAVADGTPVNVTVQGGQVGRSQLQTRHGIASVQFKATTGQSVSITASAGSAQSVLQLAGSAAPRPSLPQLRAGQPRYGDEAAAIVAARNAVQPLGPDNLRAENPTRRIDFSPGAVTFSLKGQDERLTAQRSPAAEVGFQLLDIRVGRQSLVTGQPALTAEGNWVTYRDPNAAWQVVYEAGEASLEQYFVFEDELPGGGDLVLEGRFQTTAQPVLLSDDAGLRFVPPGQSAAAADSLTLAFSPTWVEDGRGRRLLAHLELQGKQLRITIPGDWLARASYPIVVDPVLGPAQLVSSPQGEAVDPAVASDGSNFLTVWRWNDDIYGQRSDAGGNLVGNMIVINQAEGLQSRPEVVYNAVAGEYLVIWEDHRYGLTYGSVRGQRVSTTGQLQGSELEIVPFRKKLDAPAVAVGDDGHYLVVWDDAEDWPDDIYGQLLTGNGTLTGTVQLLNDNTTLQQGYPRLAYDSQTDVFLVVWQEQSGGDYRVTSQRVDAAGAKVGSNQILATGSAGRDLWYPVTAANDAGQFLVVWQEEVSGSARDVRAVRVNASTGQLTGSAMTLDAGSNNERYAVVTALSTSTYLAVWQDREDIEARSIASSDGSLGSVLIVRDNGWGWHSYPDVVHGGSQSLAVWSDDTQAGQEIIIGRRVADSGSTSGDIFAISPYYSHRQYVAVSPAPAPGSDFLLAWQQASDNPEPDIFAQRVDSQGQATGPQITVTTDLAAQERAALATGGTGYLLAWQDQRNAGSSDIYGYLLDSSGALSGTLLTITVAAGDQLEPAVAYNTRRAEYLVVWSDYRNGSNSDIYGQIVGSDGSPGATVDLSGLSNNQLRVAVVYNPDQDYYLAVWEDWRGSPRDLYGQVISPDGSLVGSDFVIAVAAGEQESPELAYDPLTGTFLVVWEDHRSGNADIYGQLLDSTAALSGSNFALATVSNDQKEPQVAALNNGEFLVTWYDRRDSWAPDIYAQRVNSLGSLLDEPDTAADESSPSLHLPLEDSEDYTELPNVAYNPVGGQALIAWNNKEDGGLYTRRYTPVSPPAPQASFDATPISGAVPLAVTFTDTSSGTVVSREWAFGDGTLSTTTGLTISHTYLATGTFTSVLTVANPGGTSPTTALITVTARITPDLSEFTTGLAQGFESFELGADPTFWVDQRDDTTARDDFKALWTGDSLGLGTVYEGSKTVYSHYAIPGWNVWQNYEYSGRLKLTADGEIGVSLYSGYPANQQQTYLLYRQAGGNFQLAAVGSSLAGDLDLGLTPQPDSWYRFRLQAVTQPDGVMLRAKVWLDGQSEPDDWQALATDTQVTRLTGGAVGVRTYGAGSKYFDDLWVTPLLEPVAAFTANPDQGPAPLVVTLTNLSLNASQYVWNFGDGTSSLQTSPVHTYTEAGVYTVTLLAGNTLSGTGGVVTDTLTRPAYINARSLQAAFAFGATTWTRPTANEPGVSYTKVVQNGQNFVYSSTPGYGYVDTAAIDSTPNNRGVYSGDDEIYDQFIGARNNGQIIFRIDVPNGQYRFVAAGGDPSSGYKHSTTMLVQDGATGPTLTLVSDFTPASASEFWTVGFDDKQAPPADGTAPDPTLTPLSGSGILTVTQGYIRVIQQVGPGSSDGFGGDLNLFEVWRLPETTSARNWHLLTTTVSPPVIGEHALTYDSDRGIVVLYGGNATGWPYESATWEFDGTDWLTTTTTGPNARYGAQMGYVPGEGVILFGGSDESDAALNQTWVYTNAAWSELQIGGPVSRTYHSLTTGPNDALYLFGGNTPEAGTGDEDTYFNDLWVFENGAWSQLTPTGDQPAVRTLAALTYDAGSDRLLLFGGRTVTGTLLADLWAFDPATTTWQLLDDGGGGGPPPRMAHSLTYDPATGNAVLAGGVVTAGETLLGDTWLYDGSWTEAAPATALPPRAYHQTVYTGESTLLFSNGEVWRYE